MLWPAELTRQKTNTPDDTARGAACVVAGSDATTTSHHAAPRPKPPRVVSGGYAGCMSVTNKH